MLEMLKHEHAMLTRQILDARHDTRYTKENIAYLEKQLAQVTSEIKALEK